MIGLSPATIGLIIAFIYIINLVINTGISYFMAKVFGNCLTQSEVDALFEIREDCTELVKMHSVKDTEGKLIWYFPSSLEKTLRKISQNQDKITTEFERISSSLNDTAKILDRISNE